MSKQVLKVDGIDVFYGTSQALFGLSFDVQQGETLALLGRNGAGKSTTMKSVAGVIPARKGTVTLHNQVVTGKAAQHRYPVGTEQLFALILVDFHGIAFRPNKLNTIPDHLKTMHQGLS